MLLAIDIGNTNFTLGVFDGKKLKTTFRMTTSQTQTSDEYGADLRDLLTLNEVELGDITDVIVASVVPNVMYSLINAIRKYFHLEPIIIEPGLPTGVRMDCRNPAQVGADQVVNAAGAYELYGGPAIVIDYGTATTYEIIDEKGTFFASVIAPGIRSSAQSLWKGAAKLPEFEIRNPGTILTDETVPCMQAGIVFGQVGQTEYIVKRMKEEYGKDGVKVIATGGLGRIVAEETDAIDVYDPDLTLHGMRIIFDRQKK